MATFALIGWLIGTTVIRPSGHRVDHASAADLPTRLTAWTHASVSVGLHANLSTVPAPWTIDWLAALAHSGHTVTWSGAPPAVAITAEASPEPDGGTRIDVAGPANSHAVLRDDASVIDSVRVSRFGATVVAPTVVGPIVAMIDGQRAVAAPPTRPPARAVVVIGQAGWEGKFAADALEESGWPVIVRFSVAPNVAVEQSAAALVFDTSRVAVVVAIDTTIARYGDAVARFVASGGGLVLAGTSGSALSVRALAPGALEARTRPVSLPADTISLGSTGLYPIGATRPDVVVLDRRPAGIAVAARRVGAGRVIQVGYDDSWRWRMAGGAGSERAHRDWWTRVVASVAYLPPIGQATNDSSAVASIAESAPVAHLVARVGVARTRTPQSTRRAPVDRRIFMTLIMILLLTEWASRRLRGVR